MSRPPGPEVEERERNGGAVSPMPLLTPVADFVEQLKEAGLHAKPYQILGPLGKGKFAMVYKAQLGEELFALKKVAIMEMLNQASRDKCLKEIQLLQSLTHQNIIRYMDSYIDPATNELVIVLQWARGGDLKKLIRKVKAGQAKIREFSEGMIWKYCLELSSGLAYMHEKRVMHRDLKPANIMLSADNHVLLGDLGLSRYFNPATMEAFSKVGTPLYISPEVLQGTGYGFAADTWSLGCILYELCTLSSPFKPSTEGVNLYALFGNIRSGKYEPLSSAADGGRFSDHLRQLITAMIRVDATQRPSMAQVAEVAQRMVELRITKRVQAKQQQQQQQQQQAQVQAQADTAEAMRVVTTTNGNAAAPPAIDTTTPSSAAAVASPLNSPPFASPSAEAESPMQFSNVPPAPLTPKRSRVGSARPLNASPLPSPSSAAAHAAAVAEMALRAVSPISPILRRDDSLERQGSAEGAAAAAAAHTAAAAASPAASSPLGSPPLIGARPPSALRPTSATRPISASHRPTSGTQRGVNGAVPVSAAVAPAAQRPVSGTRPSSQQGSVAPTVVSPTNGAPRPSSKLSGRPVSSSNGTASPSLSRQGSRDGQVAANGRPVDHFPSSSPTSSAARPSAAPVRAGSPASLSRASSSSSSSQQQQRSASPLLALTDSRSSDDLSGDSGEGERAHSPGRRGPANLLANTAAQTFLYDRASPSPSPTASPKALGRSMLRTAAEGDDQQSSYKLAHMSFASASPTSDGVGGDEPSPLGSPPPSSTPPFVGRPLSRGSISSASGTRQPVVALPLGANASSAAGGSSAPGLARSPSSGFSEEDTPPSSSPPVLVARTRSLSRDAVSSAAAVASASASTSSASASASRGNESFRSPPSPARDMRVKSASPAEAKSSSSPSKRIPLSQFHQGGDDDDAPPPSGLTLPPRPMSVDAPRPSGASAASASTSGPSTTSLPFPSNDAMMEDILESLKLLHYETRLCKAGSSSMHEGGLPWVSHDYFTHNFSSLRAAARMGATKVKASQGRAALLLREADESSTSIAVSASASPACASPTTSQQLLYFGWVCLWLLGFLLRGGVEGNEQLAPLKEELRSWRPYADYRDEDEGESDERRTSLASAILSALALARLPLPAAGGLSPGRLARGGACGTPVLHVLYRLTQAVYFKKLHGSVVLSPLALRHYPVFEPNPLLAGATSGGMQGEEDEIEDEVEEETDAAFAAAEDDEAETAYGGGGDDRPRSPFSAPAAPEDDPVAMAAATAAWMAEFARVSESSALRFNVSRIAPSGQREWQQHRETAAKYAEVLRASPLVAASAGTGASPLSPTSHAPTSFLTPSSLPTRSGELRRLLERIHSFERSLVSDPRFSTLQQSYAEAQARADTLAAEHQAASARNSLDSQALSDLESSLSLALDALRGAKESHDDDFIVRRLRRSVGELKAEVRHFDVLLGIKSVLLRQYAEKGQKRAAQQAAAHAQR